MMNRVPFFGSALIALALAFAAVALLVACGGPTGSGPGSIPATPTPTPIATQGPQTTNASGTVVDDATGNALAGVPVKLMPWAPCGAVPAAASITPENDGCPTPLPSPQATTNAQGDFTLNGAPNGHYLLVIGTDSVVDSDPVQATVHDNVTLIGGNQTLLAPTLPPVPTVTPPAWETNGDYRLATLNTTTETPCFVDWQQQRVAAGFAPVTIDEWLLENTRAIDSYEHTGTNVSAPWPGNAYGGLVTEPNGSMGGGGGATCAPTVRFTSFPNAVNDVNPQTLWFGAQYVAAFANGFAQFRIDPRAYTDPNVPNWP